MTNSYDCVGWATRYNIRCTDGRTLRSGAFAGNDGKRVPLVFNHKHDDISQVLGYADLKHSDEGVMAYCCFNDTEEGRHAKETVRHGDIFSLSIYANGLSEKWTSASTKDVMHGDIKEVSLVLAGANPQAFIDPYFSHSDEDDDDSSFEAEIYTGSPLNEYIIAHSEDFDEDEYRYAIEHTAVKADEEHKKEKETDMSDEKNKKPSDDNAKDTEKDDETVQDVVDSMTEKQKNVMYALIGQALEDAKGSDDDDDDDGGDDKVKHNIFDQDTQTNNYLSHSEMADIVEAGKAAGTWKKGLKAYENDNGVELMHADTAPVGGFVQTGEGNVSYLFPEYKDVRPGAPELITSDQGWISVVLNKAGKLPFSRVRTRFVDIRNIKELDAKGYTKGTKKSLTGNIKLVTRTTDPQTIYVKNALNKDDITDITDFDYVDYIYKIDRMMLNEEIAMCIMFGDGRDDGDADKILEEHIRPIYLDNDLYTMHFDLDLEAAKASLQGSDTSKHFGDNYVYAEAFIETLLHARENFKGSGQPDLFMSPAVLNTMLLARDLNGRRIYDTKAMLASALNVGDIYTIEQMADQTRTAIVDGSEVTKRPLGLIVNLADYSIGSTKGGEISHFTQFDIDYNQEKSLIETRLSGALTRVYSAIAIEETVAAG